jgi:phage tail-like protein
MRGAVEGLPSPHPLAEHLPAVYQEDWFAQRLMSAFDPVLAPVFSVLDNFHAYLDPALAPEDFLAWLAGWMGLTLDETWPVERCRAMVLQAAALYGRRGTVSGLRDHLEILSGGSVELTDGGGVAWSRTPGASLPGTPQTSLLVRVAIDDPASLDADRLDALVRAAKPAHLPHRIEVVAR